MYYYRLKNKLGYHKQYCNAAYIIIIIIIEPV
jgi:hypothetical protein